jgi:hypothetical protein
MSAYTTKPVASLAVWRVVSPSTFTSSPLRYLNLARTCHTAYFYSRPHLYWTTGRKLKHNSSKKLSATASGKIDWKTAPQVTGIAYNPNRYGFEAPNLFNHSPIYINARSESSTKYDKILVADNEQGIKPRVTPDLSDQGGVLDPPEGLF